MQEIEKFIIAQYQQETSTIQKDWLKDIVSNFYKPKNDNVIPDNLLQFFDFYFYPKSNTKLKRALCENGELYVTN